MARAPPRRLWLSHPPGSTFFTNVLYDLLGLDVLSMRF